MEMNISTRLEARTATPPPSGRRSNPTGQLKKKKKQKKNRPYVCVASDLKL
jgi:hypothetical protein